MTDKSQNTGAGPSKGLLLVLILLVALGIGYFIWQDQQESGVTLKVGDKEFSATIDESRLP